MDIVSTLNSRKGRSKVAQRLCASGRRPYHKMTFSIDQFRLPGKVAVVTGAGGRGNSIGRAYAIGLANAGAAVVVADLNGEGAKRVCEEIVSAGAKAIAVQVDITNRDSVANMAKTAEGAFGGVDILVNNAALMA